MLDARILIEDGPPINLLGFFSVPLCLRGESPLAVHLAFARG